MDIALLILIAMVSLVLVIAFWKGRWQLLISGFKQAGLNIKSVWFRILLGMTFGGLIQVLIPDALVAEWLGPASGLKGILIGSYVGVIMIGSPYVLLPIVASIYAAGAGAGPIIALLVSTHLIGVQTLTAWQIPLLGARLAMTRYLMCIFIMPLIGLIGGLVYQLLGVA